MFATDVEVQRINDARAGSPGHHFLRVCFADLEIVIEKASRIDRQAFPAFADVLNCEIRELDFFASSVFHTRAVRNLLLGCGIPQLTGPAKANKPPSKKMRVELFFTRRKSSGLLGMMEATRRA